MATQYYTATSIDGFIADADNSLEWLFQFDEGDESTYPAFIADVGAIAMGSTTYQWVLSHHVYLDADRPQAWMYEQPCWIFTHRELPRVDGADLRFVSGDVAAVHAEMTEVAAGRNIWVVGGGDLAGQFHDHGLLDELILSVAPVTLGAGAPLLPRKITTPALALIDAKIINSTFAWLHYRVDRDETG